MAKKTESQKPLAKSPVPKSKPPKPRKKSPAGLLLRGENKTEWPIESVPSLGMARSWAYVLRHRHRWLESKNAHQDLAKRALRDLDQLGVTEAALQQFAETSILEVQIPFLSEEEGWSARIFPWEFILHAAMGQTRGAQPLLVVRYLHCKNAAAAAKRGRVSSLMVVESMPGKLTGLYRFDTLTNEETLVSTNLDIGKPAVLPNPTLAELTAAVRQSSPDVIHLAGIDTHQAARFPGAGVEDKLDGVVLADTFGNPKAENALDMGKALTAGSKRAPRLVAFNFYNTAARLAAMAVAEGAGAAIGFQDQVDDVVAEMFFARFYRAWRLSQDWDVLEAFRTAVCSLAQERSVLTGTGVVLWSRSSLILKPARATVQAARQISHTVQQESVRILPDQTNVLDAIRVEVEPCEQINYSLLHNNRNVFKTFKVMKVPIGVMRGVQVEVELHAGGENFPFRVSQDLDSPVWDANQVVRVPLTSQLARSVQENVRTSLFVKVTCRGETVYQKTHQVTLLPMDQWEDTAQDRVWLPSFVLPRDAAVARIIDAAQRYLIALTDRIDAGFVGYEPALFGSDADYETAVDLQVRSLWWALLNELPLSYINPPPTFSYEAQRLRRPTDVIQGHRGTCLDLALVLAACLEYVDICPVIFLFRGHAYPGYCRSRAAHRDLTELFYKSFGGETDQDGEGSSDARSRAWMLGQDAYSALLQLVDKGDLVPVETVALTRRQGFVDAVNQAVAKFKNSAVSEADRFEWIYDIRLARDNGVTPLPVR